jgi:hypothetical protein
MERINAFLYFSPDRASPCYLDNIYPVNNYITIKKGLAGIEDLPGLSGGCKNGQSSSTIEAMAASIS